MTGSDSHAALGRLLEAVLGRAGVGVAVVDDDLEPTYMSRAALELLGGDAATASEAWAPIGRRIGAVASHASISEPVEIRVDGLDRTGPLVCVAHRLDALEAGGFAVTLSDAARSTRADAAVRLASWHLASQAANRSAAHDLRGALNAISLNVEVIKQIAVENSDAATREADLGEYAQAVGDELRRLETAIARMLERTDRPRDRSGPAEHETFDLRRVVGGVVDALHTRAQSLGITIEHDLAPTPAIVRGSERQLRHAILNLCVNAMEAMTGGGTLALRILPPDADARVGVEVRDDGPGVPPALADELWHPYVTTKPEALGLGLAVTKAIVDEHGGTVATRPAAPGACFEIWLPTAMPADTAPRPGA